MNQSKLIKQLTPQEIRKALYLSQLLFLILAVILSLFFFPSFFEWANLFKWDRNQIIFLGIVPALIIVLLEIVLYTFVPKKYFDDGGMNEKVFKNATVLQIAFIALVVAICEEILFRGFVQTIFGYIFASSLFAVIHYRYLTKPLLFILVVIISFLIGYLFEISGNLLITMSFHFVLDFLLGVYISKIVK